MFAHKCNEIPQKMPGFMYMLRVKMRREGFEII